MKKKPDKYFMIMFLVLSVYNISWFFISVHQKQIAVMCIYFCYAIVTSLLLGWSICDYIRSKRIPDKVMDEIVDYIMKTAINKPIVIDNFKKAREYLEISQYMNQKAREITIALDLFCTERESKKHSNQVH